MKRIEALCRPLFVISVACLCGAAAGLLLTTDYSGWFDTTTSLSEKTLFTSLDSELNNQVNSKNITHIGWAELLPERDKALANKYQASSTLTLEEQFLTSIQASKDSEYQASLQSSSSVSAINEEVVKISGFIVPIEANSERKILRFFLVPYFGACTHFPPPPPNQMVYVTAKGGFPLADITSAYSVSGIIRNAMYEDPLGTSAYVMDAITIVSYSGQPDDVRDHQSNE